MNRCLSVLAFFASLAFLVAACDSDSGGGAACDEQCGACVAVVSAVTDGDTVKLDDGRTVRYLYVDTPETKSGPVQCYGPEASTYNESLVLGKEVRLEYDVANSGCTDRYGRTLAYLWVGDVWVNDDLARRGYALKYESATYRFEAELDAALAEAREKGRGGWEECGWQ